MAPTMKAAGTTQEVSLGARGTRLKSSQEPATTSHFWQLTTGCTNSAERKEALQKEVQLGPASNSGTKSTKIPPYSEDDAWVLRCFFERRDINWDIKKVQRETRSKLLSRMGISSETLSIFHKNKLPKKVLSIGSPQYDVSAGRPKGKRQAGGGSSEKGGKRARQ